MENKLYINEKEVAEIESVIVNNKYCIVNNLVFHKSAGNVYVKYFNNPIIDEIKITTPNGNLLGCEFKMIKFGIFDYEKGYFAIGHSECTFKQYVDLKKEEDHIGQIYNPYNDSWSWL